MLKMRSEPSEKTFKETLKAGGERERERARGSQKQPLVISARWQRILLEKAGQESYFAAPVTAE